MRFFISIVILLISFTSKHCLGDEGGCPVNYDCHEFTYSPRSSERLSFSYGPDTGGGSAGYYTPQVTLVGPGSGSIYNTDESESVAACELNAVIKFENLKHQLNTLRTLSHLGCGTASLAIAVAGFAVSSGLSVPVGAAVETICVAAVEINYSEAIGQATIDF